MLDNAIHNSEQPWLFSRTDDSQKISRHERKHKHIGVLFPCYKQIKPSHLSYSDKRHSKPLQDTFLVNTPEIHQHCARKTSPAWEATEVIYRVMQPNKPLHRCWSLLQSGSLLRFAKSLFHSTRTCKVLFWERTLRPHSQASQGVECFV